MSFRYLSYLFEIFPLMDFVLFYYDCQVHLDFKAAKTIDKNVSAENVRK